MRCCSGIIVTNCRTVTQIEQTPRVSVTSVTKKLWQGELDYKRYNEMHLIVGTIWHFGVKLVAINLELICKNWDCNQSVTTLVTWHNVSHTWHQTNKYQFLCWDVRHRALLVLVIQHSHLIGWRKLLLKPSLNQRKRKDLSSRLTCRSDDDENICPQLFPHNLQTGWFSWASDCHCLPVTPWPMLMTLNVTNCHQRVYQKSRE